MLMVCPLFIGNNFGGGGKWKYDYWGGHYTNSNRECKKVIRESPMRGLKGEKRELRNRKKIQLIVKKFDG